MSSWKKLALIMAILVLGAISTSCSKRVPMAEYIRMDGAALPKDVRRSSFGDSKLGITAYSKVYVLLKREIKSKGEKEIVPYWIPVLRETKVPRNSEKMTVFLTVENPKLKKYKVVKFTEIDGKTEESVVLEKSIADVKEIQVDCPIVKGKKVSVQIKLFLLEEEGLASTKGLEVASLHYSS